MKDVILSVSTNSCLNVGIVLDRPTKLVKFDLVQLENFAKIQKQSSFIPFQYYVRLCKKYSDFGKNLPVFRKAFHECINLVHFRVMRS